MMSESHNELTTLLTRAAETMPPARVPDDIWRRGLRFRRRRRFTATLTVVVVGLLLVVPVSLAGTGPGRDVPADGDGAVPGTFHRLWPWQQSVVEAPSGPAVLLVSGDAGINMGTFDLPGKVESILAVVGADGSYRTVLDNNMYTQAGQSMLLSPDGRYVAGADTLENPDRWQERAIRVLDLTTGEVRHLAAGQQLPNTRFWSPVAWSPDGTSLLVLTDYDRPGDQQGLLLLMDVATGSVRKLLDLPLTRDLHEVHFVAYSPDSRRVAVVAGQRLVVVDTVDGTQRTLAELGPRQRLAGTGAWSLDGRRLAVFTFEGCDGKCTPQERNARTWRLDYLDAETGAPATGDRFDTLTGAAVRVVGFQRDGAAVVVRYVDEAMPNAEATESDGTFYKDVIEADLMALRPGGGQRQLLRKPVGDVWDVDVPRNLVVDGRFGGPSPGPALFPLPWWLYAILAFLAVVVPTPAVGWWALRRRS
jgi:hypothetical protein